ncbi:MAG: LysM peptidoglycan-binding domain-containing protein [Phycisphaerae bacterium]|nr:LysM peptidoglycan-binding domain-containing protein [Phycisphaerae bacterium]
MKSLAILAVVCGMMLVLTGCDKPTEPATQDHTMAGNIMLPPEEPAYDPYPLPPEDHNTATATLRPTAERNNPAVAGTYTVRKGDTLYKIAREQLGGNERVRDIKAVNPEITNWDLLRIGQVIKMPPR